MTPRRRVLIGAVAGAAGLAGIGVGLWRRSAGPAAADPWRLRFPSPDGAELVLDDLRGRPLLINFWATWCAPCVIEMPLLDRFHRAHQPDGWQVVGLAVDREVPVRAFLARQPVAFRIGLAGPGGIDLLRTFGNPSGGLPYTLAYDAAGRALESRLGVVDAARLERWDAAAKNEDRAKKARAG